MSAFNNLPSSLPQTSSSLNVGKKLQKFFLVGFLCASMLSMVGCGKNGPNQIVSDVNLATSLEDGDIMLDLSAIFNFGNISMTAVKLSLINPNDPSIEYGEFRILPTLDMKNEVGVRVNLSEAAQVSGGLVTLPNGDPLPIGGLNNTEVLELNIGQIKAKLYLALAQKTMMFGFAIPIKEFDRVSEYVGAVNIFPGFVIKGVRGMVGIFTGREEGQSGLGFFLDLSAVINPEILNRILDGIKLTQEEFKTLSQSKVKSSSSLKFNDGVKSSKSKVNKAYKMLNEMMEGQKQTLHYVE